MAIVPVDPGVSVPVLGSFPLSAEQVYQITFNALDSSETPPTPVEPEEGESANSSKMKQKKYEAEKKSQEQRASMKEQTKEDIKKSIEQKLQEVSNAIDQISTTSKEIVENAPDLLGQKVYLAAYEATHITPLETQLTIMTALAAADAAALAQQISTLKDDLSYKQIAYQQKVAAYQTAVTTVTVVSSVITTFCALFKLTSNSAVGSFLATLNSVVAALNTLLKAL